MDQETHSKLQILCDAHVPHADIAAWLRAEAHADFAAWLRVEDLLRRNGAAAPLAQEDQEAKISDLEAQLAIEAARTAAHEAKTSDLEAQLAIKEARMKAHFEKERRRKQKLPKKLRKQISYYLSDANLKHDSFYRDKISSSEGGWLSIGFIESAPRIMDLDAEEEDLVAAIEASAAKLELKKEEGRYFVRRRDNRALPAWSETPRPRDKKRRRDEDGTPVMVAPEAQGPQPVLHVLDAVGRDGLGRLLHPGGAAARRGARLGGQRKAAPLGFRSHVGKLWPHHSRYLSGQLLRAANRREHTRFEIDRAGRGAPSPVPWDASRRRAPSKPCRAWTTTTTPRRRSRKAARSPPSCSGRAARAATPRAPPRRDATTT